MYVESFNGKFRDSCLNQHWFYSLKDAETTVKPKHKREAVEKVALSSKAIS